MKGLNSMLLIAVIFLLTSTSNASSKESNNYSLTNEELQKVERLLKIADDNTFSADLIAYVYQTNQVKADLAFKNHPVLITGKVIDIKRDFTGDIYVVLEGCSTFHDVYCYYDNIEKASNLKKGQHVKFIGYVKGLQIANVYVKDCVLIESKDFLRKLIIQSIKEKTINSL